MEEDDVHDVHDVHAIAFINAKSGGQQGAKILKKLKDIRGVRVYDLADGGPDKGLAQHQADLIARRTKIICCGGDGTVCWVMSALDKLNWHTWPAIAVLPLGTGNDFARALLWGAGYEGENLDDIIRDILKADELMLDRWIITTTHLSQTDRAKWKDIIQSSKGEPSQADYDDEQIGPNQTPRGPLDKSALVNLDNSGAIRNESPNLKSTNLMDSGRYAEAGMSPESKLLSQSMVDTPIENQLPGELVEVKEIKKELVMNNYFSIGMDGRICLDFHNFRNRNPELFKNKYINYGWYGAIGLKSAIAHWSYLKQMIHIRLDGKPLELASNLLALIVLNIPSYAGGSDLWGTKSKKFSRQYVNDKKFEVVGVRGAFHFGTIQSGMTQGIRLGQGNDVEIICVEPIEAQVDGEPFKIKPSHIRIKHHNQACVLFNSAKDKAFKYKERLIEKVISQEYVLHKIHEIQRLYQDKIREASFIESIVKNIDNPQMVLQLCDSRIEQINDKIKENEEKKKNAII